MSAMCNLISAGSWPSTNAAPGPKFEEGAVPNRAELATAGNLSEYGYRCVFRKTRDDVMIKTSDVLIIDKDGEAEWDFKCPTGNGRQTVFHQFEEAAGQARRMVIDFHQGGEAYSVGAFAVGMVRKFMRYHYRIRSGNGKGSEWDFLEAMAVLKDGSLKK